MKRFFKPIEKEGSAKKAALLVSATTNPENDGSGDVPGLEDKNNNAENKKTEPLKFVTWNVNSLLLRAKNNWPEFTKFVSTLDPDVIALQEVRMPAAGSKVAPKNAGELKDDTSSSRDEKLILMRALSSPPFGNYHVWWSLADSKYAGTALLVKKCFQPIKVSFSLDGKGSKHEPDGRVILAEFETFRLLNTYAPNNGWKEEENSFQRRRKWDKRMLEFVVRLSDKPLIWCGDLNVSHDEIDVSHPDFFSTAKLNGYVPPNKEAYGLLGNIGHIGTPVGKSLFESTGASTRTGVVEYFDTEICLDLWDCGQPGFTLNERKRFGEILKEGKLIDAYRFLHKEKDMEHGFSWSGNPIGKYRGKRMRIDYFLVSEKFKDRIVSCEMHGKGIELEGFYGSDHCPVSLELSPANHDSREN